MSWHLFVIGLLVPVIGFAQPTTGPTTAPSPATQLSDAPTTAPTTRSAGFPSPEELLKKLNLDQEKKRHRVAYIELHEPLVEKPAEFSFFAEAGGATHQSIVARLYKARNDEQIKAVLITLPGAAFNLAQAQEIRDALQAINDADKKTFVYADAYDTVSYTLASGATDICVMEAGELILPGPGVETLFAKALLDKIGVQADYVQIGEYKGADESLTRTEASPQLREEMDKLVQGMYDQIVAGICRHRNLSKSEVGAVIDQLMISAGQAQESGLVDHLVDMEDLRDLLSEELGGPINLLHGYGKPKAETVDFSNPFALFSLFSKKEKQSSKPAVGLIHVDGMIVDGRGGAALTGSATGSQDLREAFRVARRDDDIKAVVLRIDSPGGSALASESIWQAARRLAEDKPVIVSIGSMAASGGYYIASAGDRIFADPSAIVGSIGVVGGKVVLKDLFEKLGVRTESFSRGRNSDLFSSNAPFTEPQRDLVKTWMTSTYELFLDRIGTMRKKKIKDLDAVARGRVFLAQQARELGMVDELGGVQEAITHAAEEAGLDTSEYEVRLLPQPRTFAEILFGEGAAAVAPPVQMAVDSPLRFLSPSARRLLLQQAQAVQLIQQRPVVLLAPFVVMGP